jgi:glyoxylase-like metal-dependent hydrolase (beta-lactamase superfamily II)
MRIPLEDGIGDIVSKAQRGQHLPAEDSPSDEAGLRRLAHKLHLGADALVASASNSWYPAEVGLIQGLVCLPTPFEDYQVNSYLVFDPATQIAAAFDTGSDCSGMLKTGLVIRQIFLTHSHPDHIAALEKLKIQTHATAYVSEREPVAGAKTFKDGSIFSIGGLRVETRRTSGHAAGGVTYVVTGLKRRLAIVGDAIFAGSMGGSIDRFEEALQTTRESILSLPADTIICPGHGPLTTVGEERRHNPFFAD